MFLLLLALAHGGPAASQSLHVGVPRLAGELDQVHMGEGQDCHRAASWLHCASGGPATWTGDRSYELVLSPTRGDGVQRGFVLARAGTRAAETAWLKALMADRDVDRHEITELRRLLVFTSDWTPPWPDGAMLQAHIALLDHPEPKVRREALEGLHPWLAGTPYDPLPVSAPVPIDASRLTALTRDPDPGVRKRLARILRDARDALPRADVRRLLEQLLVDDHPGVRRAALVALPDAVDRDVLPAEHAWELILPFLPRSRPDGRAACNQLARMRARLERADQQVDIVAAFEVVLKHHPERGWRVGSTWRRELPVKARWIRRLLEDTTGLDRTLIAHWHEVAPNELASVLASWVATRHPERRTLVLAARGDDSLSGPPEPTTAP